MSTGNERYGTAGSGGDSNLPGQFDESGFTNGSQATGMNQNTAQDTAQRPEASWHAGLDLGLLALRLVLGGIFVVHGLQKFGMFGGVDGKGGGIGVFAGAVQDAGYSQSTVLAWVAAVTELGAGVLLVLGLFTALAAAGILGMMANAVLAVKLDLGFFIPGYEYEIVLGVLALALMFTGAGRASLDRRTRWFSHAPAFGLVCLLLAAGASALTLLVFR